MASLLEQYEQEQGGGLPSSRPILQDEPVSCDLFSFRAFFYSRGKCMRVVFVLI